MILEMGAILDVSEQLKSHLEDESLFKIDRDQYIESTHFLLKKRQAAIDTYEWAKINRSTEKIVFNEEEKTVGKEIVSVDQAITQLLDVRMIAHQQERWSVHDKGKSMAKYTPQYGPPRDGAFLDKRK